ncbi:hypothetical protein K737_300333 [Holospora undulata HU1]|uniref:Uncharacterized protein n=1 Tax=Holospora undulata HU1 TaxID=1321371 RepID=A0A061JGL9_9PROT|nr:hypothetical protein K737_300333 [Holospora undulata HU1]
MRRYVLRKEEGSEKGSFTWKTGGYRLTAKDNRLFVEAVYTVTVQEFRGKICQRG